MDEPVLRILAAAVLPAVLVSAGAVMLQGVFGEHRALADRIRALSNELRAPATNEVRRRVVLAQLALFRQRVRWAMWAIIVVYASMAANLIAVLVIAITGTHEATGLVRALFVAGSAFLVVAITLIVVELRLANRTLDLEVEDHVGSTRAHRPHGDRRHHAPLAE